MRAPLRQTGWLGASQSFTSAAPAGSCTVVCQLSPWDHLSSGAAASSQPPADGEPTRQQHGFRAPPNTVQQRHGGNTQAAALLAGRVPTRWGNAQGLPARSPTRSSACCSQRQARAPQPCPPSSWWLPTTLRRWPHSALNFSQKRTVASLRCEMASSRTAAAAAARTTRCSGAGTGGSDAGDGGAGGGGAAGAAAAPL